MIELTYDNLIYEITKTIKVYEQFAEKNIRQVQNEIGLVQSLLLGFLIKNPKISQDELSRLFLKKPEELSRMVALLVIQEYLEEVKLINDGMVPIKPKRKGIRMHTLLEPILVSNHKTALKGIRKSEIEAVCCVLKKIRNNCKSAHS